jgi:hypothetical protein
MKKSFKTCLNKNGFKDESLDFLRDKIYVLFVIAENKFAIRDSRIINVFNFKLLKK